MYAVIDTSLKKKKSIPDNSEVSKELNSMKKHIRNEENERNYLILIAHISKNGEKKMKAIKNICSLSYIKNYFLQFLLKGINNYN